MKKRILTLMALMLSILVALTLVSCGETNDDDENDDDEEESVNYVSVTEEEWINLKEAKEEKGENDNG